MGWLQLLKCDNFPLLVIVILQVLVKIRNLMTSLLALGNYVYRLDDCVRNSSADLSTLKMM